MSRALRFPRLPEGPVSLVLASGEFSWLHHALCREGVQSLQTARDIRLPQPVGFHPDLQVCPLPEKQMFVLKGTGCWTAYKERGFIFRKPTRFREAFIPRMCYAKGWHGDPG